MLKYSICSILTWHYCIQNIIIITLRSHPLLLLYYYYCLLLWLNYSILHL